MQAWGGMVQVDGSSWPWQGVRQNATIVGAVSITPICTIFTAKAGSVMLKMSYLTPIEVSTSNSFFSSSGSTRLWKAIGLGSTVHSIPFSYITLDAWSNDGSIYLVEIYAEITGRESSSSSWDRVEVLGRAEDISGIPTQKKKGTGLT